MAIDLQLAGYSPSTCRVYLIHARRFVAHFRRPPGQMGADQIRQFLFHLIENHGASRQTVRQVRAALRFLYTVTLNRPAEVAWLPPARQLKQLPVVLSGTEVTGLLQAVRHLMVRTILMTMYAGGLRITEACRLLPQDIDSKRMLIHVRCGKGGVDRYTVLSRRLLVYLRDYWRRYRPNLGGYLFPGATKLRHACPDTVRKVFRKALRDAGIQKDVTPHVLRHCFATHLLECGHDITVVQALLGHRSLRATQRYVRVSADLVARTSSPLDVLGTDRAAVLG
jgi:site-specific recombinase XerD